MNMKLKVTTGLITVLLSHNLSIVEASGLSQTNNVGRCLAYASEKENTLELRGENCPAVEINFGTLNQVDRQYTFPVEAVHKQELNFAPFRAEMNSMSNYRYEEIKELLFYIDPHTSIIDNYKTHLLNKKFTVKEAYIFYLKLIEEYKFTNAILSLNPNMLTKADELDKKIEANPNVINSYPLFGVPILLKDNIITKDMPTTAGSVFLKDFIGEEDAPLVQTLENSGAVIFGKTNLSEWSRSIASWAANGYSTLGGHVMNPYGRFDVQASSGGSAFSASFFRMVTIGTDTSGSLIGPARQNSVATIKPTRDPYDENRQMIIPISTFYDNIGPMSQSVEDLARMYEVIYNKNNYVSSLNKDSLQGTRVGFLNLTIDEDYLTSIGSPVNQASIQVQKDLIEIIKNDFISLGSEVSVLTIPEEDRLTNAHRLPQYNANVQRYSVKRDLNQALAEMFKDEVVTMQDIIDFNNTDVNLIAYGQDILIAANRIDLDNEEDRNIYETSKANSVNFTTKVVDEMFEHVDVIVSRDGSLNNYYIAAGYPIVSLPIGYDNLTGEPRSIILLGRPNEEAKLLSYAYAYEQNFKPRKNPDPNIATELYKNRTAHVFINKIDDSEKTTGLLFNINGFNNKEGSDINWDYELYVNGVMHSSIYNNYKTDNRGNISINFDNFTKDYINMNEDKIELYIISKDNNGEYNFKINIWNNL